MASNYSESGNQASKVCLYAPLVVLVLGFLTLNNREGGAGAVIGYINLGIMAFGLICGLFALTKFNAENRKSILTRAIIGILINGFFLVGAAMLISTAAQAGTFHDQMIGHWRVATKQKAAPQTDVTYRTDNSFEMVLTMADGKSVKTTGVWKIVPLSKQLALTVLQTEGDATMKGKVMVVGKVRSVDDRDLVLDIGNNQEETSHRVP